MAGITDGHGDDLALLQLRRIEIAGTKEDRHHIVDTVLISARLPMHLAIGINTMLLQLAIAARIGIPHLIDVISAPLTGSLTEIKRRKIRITIIIDLTL